MMARSVEISSGILAASGTPVPSTGLKRSARPPTKAARKKAVKSACSASGPVMMAQRVKPSLAANLAAALAAMLTLRMVRRKKA